MNGPDWKRHNSKNLSQYPDMEREFHGFDYRSALFVIQAQ
jgi:hypothetical protein